MSVRHWANSESGRLSVAALLAVVMHLSLAALPLDWRPLLKQITVLRVTLTAPAPKPIPAAPQAILPIAATIPAPAPTPAPAPPVKVEPPPQPVALARPIIAPKKPPPPPKPKPEPRKSPATVRPEPPKPTPPKPLDPPPGIKTPAKESPRRPEGARLVKAVSSVPDRSFWSESAPLTGGGRNSSGGDSAPTGGKKEREDEKRSGGDSGRAPAVASSQPARSAAMALRPLPGNPPPRYPPSARQRGIEGRVLLRLTVNAGGGVEAVSIAQSSGNELLDQEAKLAVARWRFQPPGLAQAVAQVPIAFRLKD